MVWFGDRSLILGPARPSSCGDRVPEMVQAGRFGPGWMDSERQGGEGENGERADARLDPHLSMRFWLMVPGLRPAEEFWAEVCQGS